MKALDSLPNRPSLSFNEATAHKAVGEWIHKLNAVIDRMERCIDASAIYQTASTFIVARNFPKRHPLDRTADFAPIVPLLERAIDGLDADNLVERVDGLADAMSAVPGLVKVGLSGRPARPLSAASKFVWTARPHVGIIYDKLASECLMSARLIRRKHEYGDYVRAFRHERQWHGEFIGRLIERAGPRWQDKPWIADKMFDFCLYDHAGRAAILPRAA